jgi:hypothetical protein
MLIELFCAEENERGLRFWRRRGFRYVQTTESPSGRYQRLVRWRGTVSATEGRESQVKVGTGTRRFGAVPSGVRFRAGSGIPL